MATIFLYISDVEEGGQTVFPLLDPLPSQNTTVPHEALALFERNTWQADFVRTCYERLSVRPKKGDAVLFYSQLGDGEMDERALHGGCPPVRYEFEFEHRFRQCTRYCRNKLFLLNRGTKYGANLWVWNAIRHGNNRDRERGGRAVLAMTF